MYYFIAGISIGHYTIYEILYSLIKLLYTDESTSIFNEICETIPIYTYALSESLVVISHIICMIDVSSY